MNIHQPPAVMPISHQTGKFIWLPGEAKPYHRYLYARRSFELDGAPASAKLHVTAADRYLLYVNGVYLGRGPARSDPRRKSYDTYDVAPHLLAGRNTIAVRAYHYGTPLQRTSEQGAGWSHLDALPVGGWGSLGGNGYTVGERAGLWVQLEMVSPNGDAHVIGTDGSWRLKPAEAWRRDVGHIVYLVGNTEVYDARIDPVDWMTCGFDDSTWAPAAVLAPAQVEWFLLEEREIPLLRERELLPSSLLEAGEVVDLGRPGQTDIPELLNQEQHFPLENAISDNPEAVLSAGQPAARFQGRFAGELGIRAPFILIDFGRQLFGFPRVKLRAKAGAILDMTYSQQIVHGRMPVGLPYGDRYTARDGEQTWEVGDYRQFRYLQITVRSTYSPVYVESVSINEYGYPDAPRGRFECSNAVLSKLWQACVDTNYLHMEDTIVCDAYRERAPWSTGDGSHGVHMVYAAWGDIPLSDRFLRIFPLSDRGDGMLKTTYPPDTHPTHVITSFLAQWPTRAREHYLFTGRRWVLEELYPSVRKQIDWFAPYRDDTGLLRDVHPRQDFDWAPIDYRGASLVTNSLYVQALEDAAWLADHMELPRDAARWRRGADEVRAAARKLLWDEERGLYNDAFHAGRATGIVSDLGNGLAILAQVATKDQAARIAANLAAPHPDLVEGSPLFYVYAADALLASGTPGTVEHLAAKYRTMVTATDHPTLWEGWFPFTGGHGITTDAEFELRDSDFHVRPMGVRSVVHSGGNLIGYSLMTRVLGVMPTAPGFAACEIHPRTTGLDWAKGVFPAPQGDIEVSWRRRDSTLTLDLSVPAGVEADVVLDAPAGAPRELTVNGQAVRLADERDAVRVAVGAGRHSLELHA